MVVFSCIYDNPYRIFLHKLNAYVYEYGVATTGIERAFVKDSPEINDY